MIEYFYIPVEVWFYVVIPILLILLIYATFNFLYRKKRGTYYYNYVVDYVYSSLGILFCSLLLCLLLGYSIATIQILFKSGYVTNSLFFLIILIILPVVPLLFLVYILKIYVKNLKQKELLDNQLRDFDNIKLVKKN